MPGLGQLQEAFPGRRRDLGHSDQSGRAGSLLPGLRGFLWACDQQTFSTGLPAENLPSWSSTALGHRGPRRREGRAPRYPAQEDSQGAERRPPKPFCFASVIYVRQPRPFSSRFMAVCPVRALPPSLPSAFNLSQDQGLFHLYVCVSSSVMSILCSLMDCSPPGSSVHGILQARILECVAIPFSRGSSPLRLQPLVRALIPFKHPGF